MFWKLPKRINSESGAVGIMAIMAMVTLMSIGGALIVQSGIERNISTNYRDGVLAQNIAEAGIKHVLLELDRNDYPKEMSDIKGNLGNGSYNVQISPKDDKNQRKFISTAIVNDVTRRIIVTFQEKIVYDYAVCAGDDLVIKNSASVIGDIRANNNIYLDNSLPIPNSIEIDGKVISGHVVQYIDSSSGRVQHRQMIEFTNVIQIPQTDFRSEGRNIDDNDIKRKRPSDIIIYDYSLGANIKDKYHHKGDFNIYGLEPLRGVFKGKGIFYVDGSVTINGEIDGEILLIATGNINVGYPLNDSPAFEELYTWPGHFTDNSRVILIAGGDIFFNNCGDRMPIGLNLLFPGEPMHGMAIAKGSINLYGNSKIIYDEQVRRNFEAFLPKVTPILTPIEWNNFEESK